MTGVEPAHTHFPVLCYHYTTPRTPVSPGCHPVRLGSPTWRQDSNLPRTGTTRNLDTRDRQFAAAMHHAPSLSRCLGSTLRKVDDAPYVPRVTVATLSLETEGVEPSSVYLSFKFWYTSRQYVPCYSSL